MATDAALEQLVELLVEVTRLCEPEQHQVLQELHKRMAPHEYEQLLKRLRC